MSECVRACVWVRACVRVCACVRACVWGGIGEAWFTDDIAVAIQLDA